MAAHHTHIQIGHLYTHNIMCLALCFSVLTLIYNVFWRLSLSLSPSLPPNSTQVVKQTVMTVVYGVTWVGGRLQIEVRG